MKNGSGLVASFDRYISAMGYENFLYQGEPYTIASRFRGEEWDEYPLKVVA